MSSPNIEVSQHDGICEILISRPERKNALTHGMYTALHEAVSAAEADPGVRVLMISGAGQCFTSGNDLQDFLQHPPQDENAPVMVLLDKLLHARKPIVAAVSGHAVGIGTTLLLHCDLVYCDTTARFQLPFANLGLCPEAGSSYLLPLMAGHRKAAELLMLGQPFSPETAREIGLVNEVVSPEALPALAQARARQLADQPTAAVLLTKSLLRKAPHDALAAHMKFEGGHFMARLNSPEAIEAFTAFQDKRKPDFRQFDPKALPQ